MTDYDTTPTNDADQSDDEAARLLGELERVIEEGRHAFSRSAKRCPRFDWARIRSLAVELAEAAERRYSTH